MLILAAPLPRLPDADLRLLCQRWGAHLSPCLADSQQGYLQKFTPSGPGLTALASRLLARLLLFHGLRVLGKSPSPPILASDGHGRPCLPGWLVNFSHSAQAAFCALRRGDAPPVLLGLDAEAATEHPPALRAFAPQEQARLTPRNSLARWTIKEAALKAIGTGLATDPALLETGSLAPRCGHIAAGGQDLAWRLIPCPGHWLCLAWEGGSPIWPRLRWLSPRYYGLSIPISPTC